MNLKKKYLVFVTDPLENFNPEVESSLFMMREAQSRGYGIFCVTLPNLYLSSSRSKQLLGAEVWGKGLEIQVSARAQKDFYRVKRQMHFSLSKAAAVFLRKDPPFDLSYLHHLYLLSTLRGRVYMMNDPVGVMALSEKFLPLYFPQYAPATWIGRRFEEASSFIQKQKTGVVLKPLNSSGGRGVFHFNTKDSNLKVAFELLSREESEYVICQEYLPAVKKGDKRVMLLGGGILGYFTRIPAHASHRANLHSGGSLRACSLSKREVEIAQNVGRMLVQWGVDFAGIDLIGERLTEVNVTSPMGLREINATQGIKSEKKFMDFVEMKIGRKNASRA